MFYTAQRSSALSTAENKASWSSRDSADVVDNPGIFLSIEDVRLGLVCSAATGYG
jgi:hypothetical protein